MASPFHCDKCEMGFDKQSELTRHKADCTGKVSVNVSSRSVTSDRGHRVERTLTEA
jgi:uncharacterized Zn-finger protein